MKQGLVAVILIMALGLAGCGNEDYFRPSAPESEGDMTVVALPNGGKMTRMRLGNEMRVTIFGPDGKILSEHKGDGRGDQLYSVPPVETPSATHVVTPRPAPEVVTDDISTHVESAGSGNCIMLGGKYFRDGRLVDNCDETPSPETDESSAVDHVDEEESEDAEPERFSILDRLPVERRRCPPRVRHSRSHRDWEPREYGGLRVWAGIPPYVSTGYGPVVNHR